MNVVSIFIWFCLSSHYFSYFFMLENLNREDLAKMKSNLKSILSLYE